MITVQNISKKYADVQALDGISFSVEQNELFGLIGPDGAGKTSLFRILTTLLLPDGATVFNTTVRENYELVKDIYVQLEPFKNRRAGKLSGGMRQKLALCCALIHRPKVLFLDEPTTGVDAVSRKEFWEMLKRLKEQGITILVSTPYMDEAMLCQRIALIQDGSIMSIDAPSAIIDKFPEKVFALYADNMSLLLHDLRCCAGIRSCHSFGEYHHITFLNHSENEQQKLLAFLTEKNYRDIEIKPIQPTIEDCFIELMKG